MRISIIKFDISMVSVMIRGFDWVDHKVGNVKIKVCGAVFWVCKGFVVFLRWGCGVIGGERLIIYYH